VGVTHMKVHLGVETHQTVEPLSNVAIMSMLGTWFAILIYHALRADDVSLQFAFSRNLRLHCAL
jgi:hypothetical protein